MASPTPAAVLPLLLTNILAVIGFYRCRSLHRCVSAQPKPIRLVDVVDKCGLDVVLFLGRPVQYSPRVVCMLSGYSLSLAGQQQTNRKTQKYKLKPM